MLILAIILDTYNTDVQTYILERKVRKVILLYGIVIFPPNIFLSSQEKKKIKN